MNIFGGRCVFHTIGLRFYASIDIDFYRFYGLRHLLLSLSVEAKK